MISFGDNLSIAVKMGQSFLLSPEEAIALKYIYDCYKLNLIVAQQEGLDRLFGVKK